MAIQTSITTYSEDKSMGSVSIVAGSELGTKGRVVTIQATPETGYELLGWRVITTPVQLQFVSYRSNSIGTTKEGVCGARSSTIYAFYEDPDGFLYFDPSGTQPAQDGFYGMSDGKSYSEVSGQKFVMLPGGIMSACPTIVGPTGPDPRNLCLGVVCPPEETRSVSGRLTRVSYMCDPATGDCVATPIVVDAGA